MVKNSDRTVSVPSCKCLLCDKLFPWRETTLLTEVMQNDEQAELIVDAFGRKSCPLLCPYCTERCEQVSKSSKVALRSSTGRQVLASSEAFANRDFAVLNEFYSQTGLGCMAGLRKDAGLSLDAQGKVHSEKKL